MMMRCSPHLCLCLLLLVCACVCGAKGLSQRPNSNSTRHSSSDSASSDSASSDIHSSDSSKSKSKSESKGESEAVLCLAEVAGSLRLDAEGVTVSGLSSGGYMAVQLHVAFSALVHGAAVFAGGPFYCADSNAVTAQRQCMEVLGAGPNVAELVRFSGRKDALGQIDSLSNLRDDKVFLFRGAEDTVVDLRVVTSLQEYYATYVDASGLSMDLDVPAEHCLPTLDYGEECEVLASPYLGRCNVDGAGRAFATLFSDLQPRVAEANPARLLNFDQTPYFSGSRTSLDPQGFLYVPSQCQDGSTICRLHISFHGKSFHPMYFCSCVCDILYVLCMYYVYMYVCGNVMQVVCKAAASWETSTPSMVSVISANICSVLMNISLNFSFNPYMYYLFYYRWF
jgi:predicted esterase